MDCISKYSFFDDDNDGDDDKDKLQYITGKVACYSIQARMNETFYVRTNNKWPSSSTTALKNISIHSTGKKCEHNFIFNFIVNHSFRLHFRSFCARNILLLLLPFYVNVCVLILYHSLALCQPNCYYFNHPTPLFRIHKVMISKHITSERIQK